MTDTAPSMIQNEYYSSGLNNCWKKQWMRIERAISVEQKMERAEQTVSSPLHATMHVYKWYLLHKKRWQHSKGLQVDKYAAG